MPESAPGHPEDAQEKHAPTRGIDRRSFLFGSAAAAGVGLLGAGGYAAVRTREADPASQFQDGQPVVFRRAAVVTQDPERGTLPEADVLVRDGVIVAVEPNLSAPDDAAEIDAAGAVLMSGMIDTHRHMWQSVLRGVGANWTITNYFQWIYQEWGELWRPEDVYAGNYLSMVEAIDSGVTTSVDWSHGLRTPDHADAAVEALMDSRGRARLAYGNIFDLPQNWVTGGDIDRLINAHFSHPYHSTEELVTLQLAWDGGGEDPEFPERPAWEYALDRDLPVTLHAGVWGYPLDVAIENLHSNGFLLPTNTYVHAASLQQSSYELIAESGGNVSISAESELNAGQGYPPTGEVRAHGIPISLSMDTSVWWSADMFAAMRATLNADRGLGHLQAHEEDLTVVNNDLRVADVLRYATQGGADALQMGSNLGSITPGKAADLVLLRADSASMSPMPEPEHHVVFQAQRSEVDTVMVGGRVLKHQGRLADQESLDRARRLAQESLDHLREQIGKEAWEEAVNPPEFETEEADHSME
ncbi:amidohydrolase family protein [Nesterenkonia flava]|uniref:Amidohydrolase family protein n=1 Tax=Nesterenkonia flava TaxID=469799 RepID=A0ABU1FU29_9MICC|nr:amidohydrolase family protein [Nesterenkonia flava]MDR5711842.1 amidohydrolase family protein [Nesterenkonia flava]